MINLRNVIHDLTAPMRIRFESERTFQNVQFKYFANGLGTFRSINTNEPRSVEFAYRLQVLGVNSFLDIGSSSAGQKQGEVQKLGISFIQNCRKK